MQRMLRFGLRYGFLAVFASIYALATMDERAMRRDAKLAATLVV